MTGHDDSTIKIVELLLYGADSRHVRGHLLFISINTIIILLLSLLLMTKLRYATQKVPKLSWNEPYSSSY